MALFAVVPLSGGTVSNIVVGETVDSVSVAVGECVEVTDATGPAMIGSAWDGATFAPVPEQETADDPAPTE